jgi:PTH1 family peptidyl-tRNA hydrolase
MNINNNSESNIFLIAGLGNPGRLYRHNRHNIGFLFVDKFSEKMGEGPSRLQLKALTTKVIYQGRRLILVKPQTYMNLSGQSIGSLVNFYHIPLTNLLIVYDDIDLPWGKLRLRPEGGSGGHRGIKSIIEHVGSQKFLRLRIGISRPPGRMEPTDYVLQDFSKVELGELEIIFQTAIEACLSIVTEGIEYAMNQYNSPSNEDC